MKHYALLTTALFAFAPFAIAADDFGKPFTDQAPAGFEDGATADGTIGIENIPPELIEPAAGDYFDSEEQAESEESEVENEEQPEASEISL